MKCRNEYSVHLYIHMYICTVHFTSSALVSMFGGGYGWLIPFEIIFVSTFRALNFSRFIARLSLSYIVFFLLKRFDLGPIWTDKKGFANLFVFTKIFAKKVCPRSQQQHVCTTTLTHRKLFVFGKGKKLTKSNNKCNLIFSKIACPHSRWLHGHHVGAVVDSADRCCNT